MVGCEHLAPIQGNGSLHNSCDNGLLLSCMGAKCSQLTYFLKVRLTGVQLKASMYQATLLLATVVTRLQQLCYRADTTLLQLLQATKLPGIWRP